MDVGWGRDGRAGRDLFEKLAGQKPVKLNWRRILPGCPPKQLILVFAADPS